jgi:uncharacterized protein (TIGR03435 family)
MEPGLFGIARPVLLWPRGISASLDNAQLEAILAHELCHLRRRDNLAAALHLFVEALFWFHPLVWWMGTRLIVERERACDEAVLILCNQPGVYAEGILKVCEFCMQAPPACMAGVAGADLKKRVVRIIAGYAGSELGPARRGVLVGAAVMVISIPTVFGAFSDGRITPPAKGQADTLMGLPNFDVVNIKTDDLDGSRTIAMLPDGIHIANMRLDKLISAGYGELQEQKIAGLPSWTKFKSFDIEAKIAASDAKLYQTLSPERRQLMLRKLLTERFKLQAHTENKDLPVFVLEISDHGAYLKKSPERRPSQIQLSPDGIIAKALPMADFADAISPMVGRIVLDKTGLTGSYDFTLRWTPKKTVSLSTGAARPRLIRAALHPGIDPFFDPSGPSIFTVVQEQLGLELIPGISTVEVLAVDRVEMPPLN